MKPENFVSLLKYIIKVHSYDKIYGIQVYSGWELTEQKEMLLINAAVSLSLKKLKESGLILDINFDYKNRFTMIDRKIKGQWSYCLETINYIFYIPHGDIHQLPQICFLDLTEAAQDICKILLVDRNNRKTNRQDAIDFIEVVKHQLLSCGAWHIYFGYKEVDDQVIKYEKYSF